MSSNTHTIEPHALTVCPRPALYDAGEETGRRFAPLQFRRKRSTAARRPSAGRRDPMQVTAARLESGRSIVATQGNRNLLYRIAKRTADVCGALVVLAIASPIMLVTFLVLLFTTKGKPFFAQRRVGHCGRQFSMLKFRTMRSDAEMVKHLIKNELSGPVFKNRKDPRITTFGRFLRRSSIDELPQLFNVLAGHMTLVGPRPLPVSEVAKCETWQQRRQTVKPGLTCLWQVSGRSEIGFDDWCRLDIWYVNHQGLKTDLNLLWRTPWCVLTGRGAY
jgi:lipopolysaccharide/colanic/teichoic acid biosynthesis glycosyltransferase